MRIRFAMYIMNLSERKRQTHLQFLYSDLHVQRHHTLSFLLRADV